MSLTCLGIFIAYGPTVDLQKEGLGRLLGAFLQAAATREDVRFTIACPQWSKKRLLEFFESEGIPAGAFEIVSTDGLPFFLRMYLAFRARQSKPRKRGRFARLLARPRTWFVKLLRRVARIVVSTRSFVPWLLLASAVAILAAVLVPLAGAVLLVPAALFAFGAILIRLLRLVRRSGWLKAVRTRLSRRAKQRRGESLTVRFYRLMEEAEIERMVTKINSLTHVQAWYSPAAFWPGFNRIFAPRLLCVPDVVPAEFPLGFAQLQPELLGNFETVERSIRGAMHFVTYSARVKWNTLVDRYAVSPDAVSVIPHGSWDLGPWIRVRGFDEEEQPTRQYCELVLQRALARARDVLYVPGLAANSLRFLFYPSQFRPNKNLLTLLRAYEYLVRQRFIPHKLILTGHPTGCKPVEDFIRDYHLERDVLCLHGLTTPELAATYHLADLVVNPSLSEGGFPFTLTESISVNTPVVMARIAVTEEVVQDPALQEMMLFDPYDWQDAAVRIEWALQHRASLLEAQHEFCERLGQRTWRDVVGDYVTVLEHLAAGESPGASSPQAEAVRR